MTNPHPLLAGLREEIACILCDPADVPKTDRIMALLHERLGPVLEAGQRLRRINDAGAPVAEFTSAARDWDRAITRAGRPGGEAK